jgi:predicted translin family RNA/ssDNA-binding protein
MTKLTEIDLTKDQIDLIEKIFEYIEKIYKLMKDFDEKHDIKTIDA